MISCRLHSLRCGYLIMTYSAPRYVHFVRKTSPRIPCLFVCFMHLFEVRCRLFSATTLTGFHFAVTALVGMVSKAAGYSASRHIPMWELLWFSIVANMSITGMNFSLMLNSVGFYQVWNLLSGSVILLLRIEYSSFVHLVSLCLVCRFQNWAWFQ